LGYGFLIDDLFIKPILLVQLVHQADIDEYENYEHVNGSLLCEPKAEFKTTEPNAVQGILKKNARTVGNGKPNGQKNDEITDVFFPVGGGVLLFVGHWFFIWTNKILN
jgi:hypothetical protein